MFTPVAVIFPHVFYEIATLLLLVSVVGLLGYALRQPLMVAYILVGVLAGPSAFNIIQSTTHIDLFAELGITILLFLVGLKLDVHMIRAIRGVALITGCAQVLVSALAGFGLSLLLGFSLKASLYIGVALSFSSTIIIVKVLSDKREIDSLHGRIALGVLIVQDLIVVLAMVLLSALGASEDAGSPLLAIGKILLYAVILLSALWVFVRFFANRIVRWFAHSTELLIIFAIGFAACFAALCSYLGFSKELGGLLAGVAFATTRYRDAISSRLASLRDFLLLFFFISLGMDLDPKTIGEFLKPALILSLSVLLLKPLMILAMTGFLGYRKRTGFLSGFSLAQISEFSLIFIAMGVSVGDVKSEYLSFMTLIGLITITVSTYLMTYSQLIYNKVEPLLSIFERKNPYRESKSDSVSKYKDYDVILFGLGRYGGAIAEGLKGSGKSVLGVDFDPEAVRRARGRGFDVVYGDAADPEFTASLPLSQTPWVVCAVPHHKIGVTHEDPREMLFDALRNNKYSGQIAFSAHDEGEVRFLESQNVDLILRPFDDAANSAVLAITGKKREVS